MTENLQVSIWKENSVSRRPVVGVMGSGVDPCGPRAAGLGGMLAELGVHLLTGGGAGVMASVSRAFFETPGRAGSVIGILPCEPDDPFCGAKAGYPNEWVEIPIATHLPLSGPRGTEPLSRNHINILSSNAVIALPGGPGTRSEVALALKYRRPVVAYLTDRSELPGLPETVPVASTLPEIETFLRGSLDWLGARPR